jgi:hypothetical protein
MSRQRPGVPTTNQFFYPECDAMARPFKWAWARGLPANSPGVGLQQHPWCATYNPWAPELIRHLNPCQWKSRWFYLNKNMIKPNFPSTMKNVWTRSSEMLNEILKVNAHNSFGTCLEMRNEQLILYCTNRLVSSDHGWLYMKSKCFVSIVESAKI